MTESTDSLASLAMEQTRTAATKGLQNKLAESSAKKRPMNADCLDLQRLWDAVGDEIEKAKKEVMLDTSEHIAALRDVIRPTESAVQQCISDNAEGLRLVQIAQDSCDKEAQSTKKQFAQLGTDFVAQLQNGLSESNDRLKKLFSEIENEGNQHSKALQALQATADSQASQIQETQQTIGTFQIGMDQAMATLRSELLTATEESNKHNAVALADQEATMIERLETLASDAAVARAEIHKNFSKATESAFNVLDSKVEQTMKNQKLANEESCAQLSHECKSDIKELQQELLALSRAVSSVANIPTRRVEWVVRDASARFQCKGHGDDLQPGEHVEVLSKQFEVAGSRGIRLEVVRFGGDCSDNKDCAVKLIAEEGLRLLFRVSVGAVVHQLEHTFDGDKPFVTGRFCMLSEQIQHDDGTLHVGLEILEACLRLESTSSLAAIGVQELDTEEDLSDSSTFVFHRYLNHRMLDLVQDQVDVMNSRMTRRVEWRIDHASKLQNVFSEGETMCSTVFQAAGLDGLQFVLYPSGAFGAKEGFCSCFLYYPGKSELRCWLSVGSVRRDAKLCAESAGHFGRTNFCKLDQGIDSASDRVTLVLEIERAHQDVTKHAIHQTNHNTASVFSGTSTTVASALGDAGFENTLKLQKTSGHLQEVKQLPSIWTPTPQAANSVNGFHNMKDLSTKKKPSSRAMQHGADQHNLSRVRPATVSNLSMCLHSDGDAALRPESHQRPGSRIDRGLSPDRHGAFSTMSMYSDIQPCPPASARPMQRAAMRDVLSARYAAYMG